MIWMCENNGTSYTFYKAEEKRKSGVKKSLTPWTQVVILLLFLLYPPNRRLWSDVSQMLFDHGLDQTLLREGQRERRCLSSVTSTDFRW